MHSRSIATFAAAAALLAPLPCQVDWLYSVSSADGMLRNMTIVYSSTVNQTQIVRDTGGNATAVHGLARDAATGQAWAFVTFAGSSVRNFCTIDLGTGIASVVAPAPRPFESLACRADGVLFAVEDASASGPAALHRIDAATGQATLVRTLPTGTAGEAIGFAPDGGLYRASGRGAPGTDEVLERIDTTANTVANVPLDGADYDGLTVLVSYTGSYLYGVDTNRNVHFLTTGGEVRHYAQLDHGPVTGLAFVPAPAHLPFFRQYGDGCEGSDGAFPLLLGCGNPSGGHNPGVHLRYAPPNGVGVLAAGTDDGVLSFPSAACRVQIDPVSWAIIVYADANGAFNTWFALPPGSPPVDFHFQMGFLDGSEFTVTNPVRMHVR